MKITRLGWLFIASMVIPATWGFMLLPTQYARRGISTSQVDMISSVSLSDQETKTELLPRTTTLLHFAAFTMGPVHTVYAHTITETLYLECHGHSQLITKNIGGPGPVVFQTTTVTDARPTTTTMLQCMTPESKV
ncbi:unnamed protein product [Blumeria hordei]|uniref:Uncharacterized protein n=1 Tax=Blumeria hordei TaxID=2867405 RepID=A0A383UJK4_BLUHO|nr:unnamed protein product [Blumeria hordei]